MKTIAYTALHYGRDYLASAIQSVIDAVDEYYVLYTPVGSHGHRAPVSCPESRDELYEIARRAAGSKLRWHEATWDYEGQQRDAIHQIVPDADVVLVLDADEVWSESVVTYALRRNAGMHTHDELLVEARRLRFPMIHAWRTFSRWVLHDPAYPERVIYPQFHGNTPTACVGYVFHFGYAQRPEIVQYKQLTHGHKGEWRKDCDWFRDRFMANAQADCHPVGSQYWNPEPVDPFALGLPEWMRQHPYAGMEVIE